MADECDTSNKFMVGVSGARITFLKPIPHTISKDDALNLAAWLVALADEDQVFGGALQALTMTDRLRELAGRPTDRTAIEWLSDRIEAKLSRGERHFQLEGAELGWVIDAIRRHPHGESGATDASS